MRKIHSASAVLIIALSTITNAAAQMVHKRMFGLRHPDLPDPNNDPFYATPANISRYCKGEVIQSRNVNTTIGDHNKATSYQISFRSLNTQNKPQKAITTVFVPAQPVHPPQIMSYQFFEDSTSLDCSPSYNFLSGWSQPDKLPISFDAPIIIGWALKRGIYVVAPDHEGPESAFIAGFQEGMATLDGLRATISLLKLPKNTGIAFLGYSGGGSATVWAATLAPGYAPDLNIIGAAHGGTPIDSNSTFQFINKGPFAGFALGGISGLALAYPDMEAFLEKKLNAKGLKAMKKIRARGFCLPGVVFSFPFTDVYKLTTEGESLSRAPVITAVMKRESLLQTQASWTVPIPKFPRFIWHAVPDEIVPFKPAKQYVEEQCAGGADIYWDELPFAEHIIGEMYGIKPSLHWLELLFAGNQPKVKCGTAKNVTDGA